jgi:protein-disulfide isomerase
MPNYSTLLANVATVAVTALALVVGGARVRDELRASESDERRAVENWRAYASEGQRIGPENARVTIVEFADFQCPFCQRAWVDLHEVLAKHPEDVALVYRHYPLPIHEQALPAARAAHCASRQGGFAAFHDVLFAQFDSVGTRSWEAFARDAGLRDPAAIAACAADTSAVESIERDLAAAERLGVDGTPTFLINERFVVGYPGEGELARLVMEALGQ